LLGHVFQYDHSDAHALSFRPFQNRLNGRSDRWKFANSFLTDSLHFMGWNVKCYWVFRRKRHIQHQCKDDSCFHSFQPERVSFGRPLDFISDMFHFLWNEKRPHWEG
jgi:hypothetical protein